MVCVCRPSLVMKLLDQIHFSVCSEQSTWKILLIWGFCFLLAYWELRSDLSVEPRHNLYFTVKSWHRTADWYHYSLLTAPPVLALGLGCWCELLLGSSFQLGGCWARQLLTPIALAVTPTYLFCWTKGDLGDRSPAPDQILLLFFFFLKECFHFFFLYSERGPYGRCRKSLCSGGTQLQALPGCLTHHVTEFTTWFPSSCSQQKKWE